MSSTTLCKSEQHSSADTSVILVATLAPCWGAPHVIPCLEDASHTNHAARDWGQHAHPGILERLSLFAQKHGVACLQSPALFIALGHMHAHAFPDGVQFLVLYPVFPLADKAALCSWHPLCPYGTPSICPDCFGA